MDLLKSPLALLKIDPFAVFQIPDGEIFGLLFAGQKDHADELRLQVLKVLCRIGGSQAECFICFSKSPASAIVDARSPNPFGILGPMGMRLDFPPVTLFSWVLVAHTIP